MPDTEREEDETESDDLDEEYDEEDADVEKFRIWLKDVSECLRGFRKVDPDKMQTAAEEKLGDETEEERSMRIVRSVLDEETALDMVKTYLEFTKEAST